MRRDANPGTTVHRHPSGAQSVRVDVADRIDRALSRLVPGVSRTAARRLLAAGAVFLNGHRCRVASRTVRAGDTLQVSTGPAAPPAAPLTILYEDVTIIAVDKPAGMPSAPTRQAAAGSALDVLRAHLRERDGRAVPLWVVHRLDTATSGVLVFARTRPAAAALSGAFARGEVKKTYLARVTGVVADDAGCVDLPLHSIGQRSVPSPDGRPAVTEWQVLDRAADTTLLAVHPRTGRMHQVRVHLRALGHPIVGDRRYGGPPGPRLLLHAGSIRLTHPVGGAVLDISSAPPPEFGATGAHPTRQSARTPNR